MRKNISVTNPKLIEIYNSSSNTSKLIEEATLYYVYAVKHKMLNPREINRILAQRLLDETTLKNIK